MGLLQKYSPFLIYVLKVLSLIIILLIAVFLSLKFLKKNVRKLKFVTPTNRIFIEHILQTVLLFIALIIGLDTLGLNLRSLAVISGALFLGIGFGIQKIASNFISGLILLFDKAIQVNDMVELKEGTFGRVQHIGMLYTIIETLDLKEIMVPNETFLIDKVINCTHSNREGRIDVIVTVSYDSDVEKAMDVMVEIAKAHPRANLSKAPVCFVKNLSDSGVELFLVLYIEDITKGRFKIKSDIHMEILKKFKKYDIEIPYPIQVVKLEQSGVKV